MGHHSIKVNYDSCSPSYLQVMTDLLDTELNAASATYSPSNKLAEVMLPKHFPVPFLFP